MEELTLFHPEHFLEQQGSLFPYEPQSLDEIVWPSASKTGVPELDIEMQATKIVDPFRVWGEQSRKAAMPGTYAFYTDDYKFTALWSNPDTLIKSCCTVAVEPNFSVRTRMPFPVAIYGIFRKRWLSRYWQEHGVNIIVDMNVAWNFLRLNLIGVPKGWRAYATRAHKGSNDMIVKQYQICQHHAETNDILFLVYGGSDYRMKALCDKYGWIHIPEKMHTTRIRKRQEQMQREYDMLLLFSDERRV